MELADLVLSADRRAELVMGDRRRHEEARVGGVEAASSQSVRSMDHSLPSAQPRGDEMDRSGRPRGRSTDRSASLIVAAGRAPRITAGSTCGIPASR